MAAAAALVPLVSAPASAAPPRVPDRVGAPVHLALGDSVAAGVGARPYVTGYPELTVDRLSAGYNPAANKATRGGTTELELVSLAVGGATTTSLIAAQLPQAVALIAERRADRDPFNDVEVITLTISGNDVFTPVLAACVLAPDPSSCQAVTDARLSAVSAQLTSILEQLTAAAGPRAEVVVTTYYNPIGSCFVTAVNPAAPAIADVVLEGGTRQLVGPLGTSTLTLSSGLNDVIRAAAATTGAQVADLYGRVVAGQFVGGSDCLHPNQAGHATTAEIVYETLAR